MTGSNTSVYRVAEEHYVYAWATFGDILVEERPIRCDFLSNDLTDVTGGLFTRFASTDFVCNFSENCDRLILASIGTV